MSCKTYSTLFLFGQISTFVGRMWPAFSSTVNPQLKTLLRAAYITSSTHPGVLVPHPLKRLCSHSTMPTPSPPAGLLYVYMDPGPDVTDAEFHDWYDNEHVPLRMELPTFRCATRWVAADGAKPEYLAMYDLAAPSALDEPAYLALRESQSAREADVMARIQRIDRRVYDTLPSPSPVSSSSAAAAAPEPGLSEGATTTHELTTADYDARAPGPVLVAVEIAMRSAELEEELARWYRDEHLPLLARVPGWRRSRRFALREAGPSKALDAAARGPARLMAVHEWDSPAAFETAEFGEATSTAWRTRMVEGAEVWERRTFRLRRAWVQG